MSDDTGAGAGSNQGLGTLVRPPEPDDRAVLAGLIWTLYDDLDAVSALRFVLFAPGPNDAAAAGAELEEFLNLWGPAWTEIAATRDAVIDQIRSADPDQLRDAGLAGPQLAMKVAGWRYGRARMLSVLDDGEDASDVALPLELAGATAPAGVISEPTKVELKQPGLLRRACRVIAGSFGLGDTVLSSLAGIVSLSEPLREGKEFMEHIAGTVADGVPE